MKKFIELLKTKEEKYNDLLITGVEYELHSNILRVKAQYICDTFSDEWKDKLEQDIQELLGNSMIVECKLKKYSIDVDVVKEYVLAYLQIRCPSAITDDTVNQICVNYDNGVFVVIIGQEKDNFDYLKSCDFENLLDDYLQLITKEEFEIHLECIEKQREDDREIDILKLRYATLNSSELVKAPEYDPIEVKNIHNVVGEIDVDFVYPIATLDEQDKAVFVGTIQYARVSEYESKSKTKEGSGKMCKRVNFVLNDGSGKLNCVYFPTMADEEKIESLIDGEKIVAIGDIKDSEERGRTCRIKSFALCAFDPYVEIEPEIELKTVNDKYHYVFPQEYSVDKQSDLFVEKEEIDEFLMQNTVVVFDLETTGLNVNECEIVEIGAVKLVEGKIVETFETLVKPKNPIPAEATAINNITNEMVEGALGIDLIFPDFYKFIDGVVLVAYNISYDYSVLKAYGDKNGYVIDNRQLCALKLAKKVLPNRKSYKLGRVVHAMGIELKNAHRAVFDTIATAELLKKALLLIDEKDKEELLNA